LCQNRGQGVREGARAQFDSAPKSEGDLKNRLMVCRHNVRTVFRTSLTNSPSLFFGSQHDPEPPGRAQPQFGCIGLKLRIEAGRKNVVRNIADVGMPNGAKS
jgi:hypothetical protein